TCGGGPSGRHPAFPDASNVRGSSYIRRRRRFQKAVPDYVLDRNPCPPAPASHAPRTPGLDILPTKLGFGPTKFMLRTGPSTGWRTGPSALSAAGAEWPAKLPSLAVSS